MKTAIAVTEEFALTAAGLMAAAILIITILTPTERGTLP